MNSAAQWIEGHKHFIGTITPSGNTVVERITLGILRELPSVSAHFSRTPVFGSVDPSPKAYATEGLLAAARLLAHASPAVLVWNGSKGVGIGFAHDRELARSITAETGIPATTSVLGLDALLRAKGLRRLAVLSPYSDASQQKAIDCLVAEGYEVVAEAHAGFSDNLSYASVPLPRIADMARSLAASAPQAIVSVCTNFPAAAMAAPIEAELGIPLYDTTALGVWHALHLCVVDASAAAPAWGSLFSETLAQFMHAIPEKS
ncbi:MAG: Asp/Glu/hydantoin racemase [Polaromonas sp.]|nr:Asp/Glu/hydantoin racemase [Polaromonas sp.]